jgi:hemoglobin
VREDPILAPLFANMPSDHPRHVAAWLAEVFGGPTGLPDDPEFRSAFLAYVEWGTRLAKGNSEPGADPPRKAPVPRWGWGEAPPFTG